MADTINILEKTTPYVFLPDLGVYAKRDSLEFLDYSNDLSILLPVAGQISATNASYIDFDLTNASSHRFDNLFLEVPVSNSHATDLIIPMPLSFMINRVELLTNNSTVATMYSNDLFTQTLVSNTDTLINRGVSEGFSTSVGLATYGQISADVIGVPAGTTRKYSLPIHSFLTQCFGPILKQNNFKVRVYFNQGNALIASFAGAATIANVVFGTATLYVQGRVYGRKTLDKLVEEYRKAPHIARTIIRRQQIINMGSVSAGVQYSQLLGSLTGAMSTLRVTLVDYNSASPATAFSYKQLNDLTLLDSAGKPWSFQSMPDSLLRQQVLCSKYDSVIDSHNFLYELPLGRDPLKTFQSNVSSGSLYMDGRWTLKFTPTANSANVVSLYVNAHEYAAVKQLPSGAIEIVSFTNRDY